MSRDAETSREEADAVSTAHGEENARHSPRLSARTHLERERGWTHGGAIGCQERAPTQVLLNGQWQMAATSMCSTYSVDRDTAGYSSSQRCHNGP